MENYNVYEINENFQFKQEFVSYIKNVSWSAGPFLANMIEKKQDSNGYDRVYAVMFKEVYFCGFCHFSAKDCIETTFEPWIGFLFVDEKHRGKHLSKLLIDHCIKYARILKFEYVYLASQELGFYEKYGFKLINHVIDIYGDPQQLFAKSI